MRKKDNAKRDIRICNSVRIVGGGLVMSRLYRLICDSVEEMHSNDSNGKKIEMLA